MQMHRFRGVEQSEFCIFIFCICATRSSSSRGRGEGGWGEETRKKKTWLTFVTVIRLFCRRKSGTSEVFLWENRDPEYGSAQHADSIIEKLIISIDAHGEEISERVARSACVLIDTIVERAISLSKFQILNPATPESSYSTGLSCGCQSLLRSAARQYMRSRRSARISLNRQVSHAQSTI